MQIDILRKCKSMQALALHVDKGESLPLHDHPETHVFMYVTKGMLKVDFYRYKDGSDKKVIELEKTVKMGPGMHQMITSDGVNLHHIEALEDSTFIDVMAPGYFENENPPTWFEVDKQEGQMVVREVPQPELIAKAKEVALEAFEEA